jgi:anti-sigma factor RsiW
MPEDLDLEFELHAYVDGDLDEDNMSRIERYLRTNAEAAARVRAYLRQKETLRSLAKAERTTAPSPEIENLTRRLARRLRPSGFFGWQRTLFVAAMLAAGWTGHMVLAPLFEGPQFTQEAVQAHLLMTVEPGEVLPISQERMTKLFARVGATEKLPDLAPFGFEPIGAELVPSDDGILLHVPYRDKHGTTMSYFLVHDEEVAEIPRHILHREGVTLAYWQHENERYAVAAPLSDDEISRIAAYVDTFETAD